MMSTIIEMRGVGKLYGAGSQGHRALSDLDLAVEEGEIFGFLGPNGAGKSTTIRILLGLLRPTEGEARVFGLDSWREGERLRAGVGYLPGEVRFRERQTGLDVVRLLERLRGVRCGYRELAERLELDLGRPVRAYSKGMRQKLGLIQALMHEPPLVVLDEPTSGLDPLSQRAVNDLLRERRSDGATIFFSSHVLPEVEGICDRVALLRGGRLLRCAPLEEFAELRQRRFEVRVSTTDGASRLGAKLQGALGGELGQLSVVDDVVTGQVATPSQFLHVLTESNGAGPNEVVLDSLRLEAMRLEDLFYEYYEAPEQTSGTQESPPDA